MTLTGVVQRAHQPIGNLVGLVMSSTLTVSALGGVAQQIQEAAPATDFLPTGELITAIVSLVGALVFVHRLLMQSEAEKLLKVETGFLGVMAAKDEKLVKVEALHLAVLEAKDETIRRLGDQLESQEATIGDLRVALEKKEQALIVAIQEHFREGLRQHAA